MSKTTSISFETVSHLCNSLQKEGQSITVRGIHAELGGSFATLSKHIKRWREDGNLISSQENISDIFRIAALTEIKRVVDASTSVLTKQLSQEKTHAEEVSTRLGISEEKIDSLTSELQNQQDISTKRIAELETELAVARDRLSQETNRLENQIEKLQLALQSAESARHEAELQAARAETRCEEMVKRFVPPPS